MIRASFPKAPHAEKIQHQRIAHDDIFTDVYDWMRNKESQQVHDYIAAQNAFCDEITEPIKPLTTKLFSELKSRVQETDMSVPTRIHDYWYFARTVEGEQYGKQCRIPVRDFDDWTAPVINPEIAFDDEEVIFDANKESQGHDFFRSGGIDLSNDGRWMVYSTDTTGNELYDVRIRDLSTGKDLPEVIEQVSAGACITPDGQWVFYTKTDDAWRPYSIWRHRVGTDSSQDQEAWHENDEKFWAGVGISFDETQIVIETSSKTSCEVLMLDVTNPQGEFKPFIERQENVEYDVSFAQFEGGAEDSSDIPLALVIHNVKNPNFEVDVIDMRLHQPPYSLGEGVCIARGSAYGCEPVQGRVSVDEAAKSVNTPLFDDANPDILQGLTGLRIDGIGMYRDFVTLGYRADGLPHIAIMSKSQALADFLAGERWNFEELTGENPNVLYSIGFGSNSSYQAPVVRYTYGSYTQPSQLHEYNPVTSEDKLLKRANVRNYKQEDYAERRVWVRVRDGQKVPVSLVWKRGLVPSMDSQIGPDGNPWSEGATDIVIDAPSMKSLIDANRNGSRNGKNQASTTASPMFISGYGSYEISSDPGFSVARPSMLDRGVLYTVAHIRGGGEMGRAWYEKGRRLNKINTFTDFIDVTAALQAQGWASAESTVANGGSAGGLLIGAVANVAGFLYKGIEADVPFVDALTSILDTSLPLTVTEWDEWGDPLHNEDVYHYMKSYSPYENVLNARERKAKFGTDKYPTIFITTSLNDTRVLYVEPLKWLARMQESGMGIDAFAKIEVEAGHGGVSGRYKQWEEVSFENAWCLEQMGLLDS